MGLRPSPTYPQLGEQAKVTALILHSCILDSSLSSLSGGHLCSQFSWVAQQVLEKPHVSHHPSVQGAVILPHVSLSQVTRMKTKISMGGWSIYLAKLFPNNAFVLVIYC